MTAGSSITTSTSISDSGQAGAATAGVLDWDGMTGGGTTDGTTDGMADGTTGGMIHGFTHGTVIIRVGYRHTGLHGRTIGTTRNRDPAITRSDRGHR